MKRFFDWLTSPKVFLAIGGLLSLLIFIFLLWLLQLVFTVWSVNTERRLLNQDYIIPVLPINELSNLINSISSFFTSAAGWSGLFTLLAAIYAGKKALQVSQHRKAEAEAADFRDSMKWAVEHINLDATDPQEIIQSNWALSLIEKYVDNPPSSLSNYDKKMAEQLLEEIAASISAEEQNTP